MKKIMRTTIHITEKARTAYIRMIRRYGIRAAVSAGIILLDRLTPEERENIIDEANSISPLDSAKKAAQEDEAAAARASRARPRKRGRLLPKGP